MGSPAHAGIDRAEASEQEMTGSPAHGVGARNGFPRPRGDRPGYRKEQEAS